VDIKQSKNIRGLTVSEQLLYTFLILHGAIVYNTILHVFECKTGVNLKSWVSSVSQLIQVGVILSALCVVWL
jgi:hypothetical protein